MPEPIATWNPARGVWETPTTNLLCEHSEPFSQTWPTSGMTLRGVAYALPTWEPPTDGSACSSWPGLEAWTPRPRPLTVEDAWMAGLFEGEGYISVRTDTKKPRVLLGLQMTDFDAVERFYATAGMGRLHGPYDQKGLGTKPTLRWTTSARAEVETLLNRMWDGLCSRRQAKAIQAMSTGMALPQQEMLPTPRATRGGSSTETAALLPTPNTHNWKESGNCRDFGADMTHALTCGCQHKRT